MADRPDITFRCQDNGFRSRRNESKFLVKMIDVNDVKPEFSNETYMFRFDENQDLNTRVGVISATDSELGTGDMSTYSLADGAKVLSTPFNVSDDGIILVRSASDYEAKYVYEF